ncbi:MAG: DUF4340 domain-containing protein [candidate division Zixibacteria bacterium]|nr:DUF4340 domain-containing protein [candidate division Zixibacteria bacterium]
MMKRSLIVLVVALVALWLGWHFYSSSEEERLSVPQHERFFVVDTSLVDSAAMKYADWTHLSKIDGQWIFHGDDYTYPANAEQLMTVFETTNKMVLENMISRSPSKFRKFEVDTTRGRVMRFYHEGEPLAEFVIGKLGPGVTHTYVRQLDSDSVYLARGRFRSLYTQMPDMWKSSVIIPCDTSTVDTIRWIYPDEEVRLARSADDTWMAWSSVTGEQQADSAAVSRVLNRMCPFTTHTFLPDGSPDNPDFSSLALQLIIVHGAGTADTVIWAEKKPDEQRLFARLSGQGKPIFLFGRQAFDQIAYPFDSLVVSESAESES